MANWDTFSLGGFILLSQFIGHVLSQAAQCYYVVVDPTNPQSNAPGQKYCFNGCCSQTTYEPCCANRELSESISPGAIGGIIIGCVIALIIFGGVVFYCMRKSKMKDKPDQKYITQAKPTVSYIATSDVTEGTDYKRENEGYFSEKSFSAGQSSPFQSRNTSTSYLPPAPVAKMDDDSDLDTASNHVSYKTEPRSYSSNRNRGNSTTSMDSRDNYVRSENLSVESDQAPYQRRDRQSRSNPSRDEHSRDHQIHDQSSREGQARDSSRDRKRRESPSREPRQHKNSTSSMDSRDHHRHQQHHHHHRPRHSQSRQHSRNYAPSTSSVDSRDHNRSISERQSVTSDLSHASMGTTV